MRKKKTYFYKDSSFFSLLSSVNKCFFLHDHEVLVIDMKSYFLIITELSDSFLYYFSVPEPAAHCSPSQPARPPLRGPRASQAPPSWSSSPRLCTARRCASHRCTLWHLWVPEYRWDWRLAADLLHLTSPHLMSSSHSGRAQTHPSASLQQSSPQALHTTSDISDFLYFPRLQDWTQSSVVSHNFSNVFLAHVFLAFCNRKKQDNKARRLLCCDVRGYWSPSFWGF